MVARPPWCPDAHGGLSLPRTLIHSLNKTGCENQVMGGVVFNGNWLFSLAQPRGEITNLWKAALEHAWHSENGLTRQPWGVWWRSLNSQWHLKQSRLSQVTLWTRAQAGALGQQRQRASRAEDSTTRLLPSDALQLLPLVFSSTHHVNSIWKLTFMLSQEVFTGLWNDSRLTLYVPTFYEHPIEILLPQLPECWHYRQTLPWSQGVSFHIL